MAKAGLYAGEVTTSAPADSAATTKAKGYQWLEHGDASPPVVRNNCTEVYGAGTLTPDLHVAGVDELAVWNKDLIDGIGNVSNIVDASESNMFLPAESGEWELNQGYNVGVETGVTEYYYPQCQWYAYAGPDINNMIATGSYSNFSLGAGCTESNAEAGLGGVANTSAILTDNNATTAAAASKRSTLSSVDNDDGRAIVARIVVEKDLSAAHYSRFEFGAGDIYKEPLLSANFSQATGEINVYFVDGAVDYHVESHDAGDYWDVYLQMNSPTTGTAGTNGAEITILPSWSLDGTTADVTLTGLSIKIVHIGILSSLSFDIPIGHVRRGGVIPSLGTTWIDQSNIFVDPSNHSDGGYYIEWRPTFAISEISRDVEILSLNDSTGLLWYDYADEAIKSSDGTNTATYPLVITAGKKYRVGVVFQGGSMVVGVDATWGTSVLYDGSYVSGSNLTIFRNPEAVNLWRDLQAFHTTFTAAKDEITELMLSDTLVLPPYDPGMMTFNGASYYHYNPFTTAGNSVQVVFRFNVDSFAGDVFYSPVMVLGSDGANDHWRVYTQILSSTDADVDKRNGLSFYIQDDAGGTLVAIISNVPVADSTDHVCFFSYNATTGDLTFTVDGVDADLTTWGSRVVTTGTLETGAFSRIGVGADPSGLQPTTGQIGYVGYKDQYATNFADFYDPVDGLQPIEEKGTWKQWNGQPEYWNQFGTMTDNKGTDPDLTEVGTITGPS